MEYFINKIGERLKQIRLKLELSQKYLADLLGINQKTISHWEQDRNEPNMKALRTLCSHFDINLNWLLTGEGEMFISRSGRSQSASGSNIAQVQGSGNIVNGYSDNSQSIGNTNSMQDKRITLLLDLITNYANTRFIDSCIEKLQKIKDLTDD